MKVRELTDQLIWFKKKYEIYYPDDNVINAACNIIDRLPQELELSELLSQLEEENLRGKRKIFDIQ